MCVINLLIMCVFHLFCLFTAKAISVISLFIICVFLYALSMNVIALGHVKGSSRKF
jgi:hypothetical protein